MWTLLAPVVAALALQGEPWEPVQVDSPDGPYYARIDKVRGQERVRDKLARWQLTVRDRGSPDGEPVWSTFYPFSGRPQRYFLSRDGQLFVHVVDEYSDGRPAIFIHRQGREPLRLSGGKLGLDRRGIEVVDGQRLWLAEDGGMEAGGASTRLTWLETPAGPRQYMRLESRDGAVRLVDVSTGRVFREAELQDVHAVTVDPPLAPEHRGGDLPLLTGMLLDGVARAGDPLEIELSGTHSTPGWRLLGVDLVREGDQGSVLVLEPRARKPANGVYAQKIEPFRVTIRLHGLTAGSYTVRLRGKPGSEVEPVAVEVLPAGMLVHLHTTGGIIGLDDVHAIYEGPGEVVQWRSRTQIFERFFPLEAGHVLGLVSRLPKVAPQPATTRGAADMLQYRIGWWRDGRWHETALDDGTLKGPVGDLVRWMRMLP